MCDQIFSELHFLFVMKSVQGDLDMLRAMECITENRIEKARNWLEKQKSLIDDCCQDRRDIFMSEIEKNKEAAKTKLIERIASEFKDLELALDPSLKQYLARYPEKRAIYDRLETIGRSLKHCKLTRTKPRGPKAKSQMPITKEEDGEQLYATDASEILQKSGLEDTVMWTDGLIYYKGTELHVGDEVWLRCESRLGFPKESVMYILDISKDKAIMQEQDQDFIIEVTPEDLDSVYTLLR